MAEMEPLFDKKCVCPICDNKFTTKRIRSRFIKVISYDTDLCPIYQEVEQLNPILYHVQICPACGYSYSEDFSPYFPTNGKDIIIDKVSTNWTPQSFSEQRTIPDAIKTYKLAVYCATLKKEKHIILAGMYLRLAWLYRILLNDEQEQRFMKLAIGEYTESYSVGDFQNTQVSELKISYLLGELYRRTNQTEYSVKYFSKVIEKQKISTEPRLVEMAKERWNEIRDSRV
jgi:uncharacterized protein